MYYKLIAELKNEFGITTKQAKYMLDGFMKFHNYTRESLWKLNHIGCKEDWKWFKVGISIAVNAEVE